MNGPFRIRRRDELRPSSSLVDAVEIVRSARVHPGSEQHRRTVLDFCTEHADALHRSCEEGHLTGSAAVLEERTGRVALLLHAKVGRWLQPGGHADGEANLALVSWTEAAEETGLAELRVVEPAVDVDVHVFDAPTDPRHLHLDVRHLVVAPEGAVLRGNHESHDLRWFDVDDLDGLGLDDGTHRLLGAARRVAARAGLIG